MWTNQDSQKLLGGMENSAATLENNLLKKLKIHLPGDPGRPSHPAVGISSRDTKGDPCTCECSQDLARAATPAGLELDLTLRTFCSDGSEQIRFHQADLGAEVFGIILAPCGISGNLWHDGSASGTIPSYRIIFRDPAGLLCFSNFCCCCLVAKSCLTFATPWMVAHLAPLSMVFPRWEYWSGLLFPPPGDLPNPGIKPEYPALAGGFLTAEPPGKPFGNI